MKFHPEFEKWVQRHQKADNPLDDIVLLNMQVAYFAGKKAERRAAKNRKPK